MQKIIYYIFLIAAVIAFLCGLEVSIMLSLAFYHSGAFGAALQTWLAPLYWLCLLIALLLIFRKTWGIFPLLAVTPIALHNAYLNLRYSHWPSDLNWWCNYIAAMAALVMVIVGCIYYLQFYLKRD